MKPGSQEPLVCHTAGGDTVTSPSSKDPGPCPKLRSSSPAEVQASLPSSPHSALKAWVVCVRTTGPAASTPQPRPPWWRDQSFLESRPGCPPAGFPPQAPRPALSAPGPCPSAGPSCGVTPPLGCELSAVTSPGSQPVFLGHKDARAHVGDCRAEHPGGRLQRTHVPM